MTTERSGRLARVRALAAGLRRPRLIDGSSRPSGVAPAEGDVLDHFARSVLSRGVSLVGALAAGIFLLDEARANLELKAAFSYPADLADRYRLISMSADLPITEAVNINVPVFLEGKDDYGNRYPAFSAAYPELARNGFAAM